MQVTGWIRQRIAVFVDMGREPGGAVLLPQVIKTHLLLQHLLAPWKELRNIAE